MHCKYGASGKTRKTYPQTGAKEGWKKSISMSPADMDDNQKEKY